MTYIFYDRIEDNIVIENSDSGLDITNIINFFRVNKVSFLLNSNSKEEYYREHIFDDISNISVGVFFKHKKIAETVIGFLEYYGFYNIKIFSDSDNIFSADIIITDKDMIIKPDNMLVLDIKESPFIIDRLKIICQNYFSEYSERFYSLLFHKFKNPMSTMYGYIQLLASKVRSDEKALKYYNKISEQFNLMNDLVGKTSGLLLMNNRDDERFDLYDFFSSFNLSLSEHTGKSIIIHALSIKGKKIFFNKDMFEKVIKNIFLNYIEINDRAKYIFNIELEENDFYELKIIAEDMKIPVNHINKIFEPFFSSRKGKNFGIGMNEVKKVLNIKNCGLYVCNLENSSVFIIFLPKKILTCED